MRIVLEQFYAVLLLVFVGDFVGAGIDGKRLDASLQTNEEAMEKKLVDRADVMVWKLKKGRVCCLARGMAGGPRSQSARGVDEVVSRQGPLWDRRGRDSVVSKHLTETSRSPCALKKLPKK